jgi:predicted hotdog family 3-hydroxylacyl-ACP dehydratase
MAIHARLVAPTGTPPSLGYLASLRDVRFGAAQLDAATGDLIIEAARLMGNAGGATYTFTLTRGATLLLSGRATVLLMIGT